MNSHKHTRKIVATYKLTISFIAYEYTYELSKSYQIASTEFERSRKLFCQLVHAVQPLNKYRALFPISTETTPIRELVPKGKPLPLNENFEPVESTIERVQ